jgi:hypothetical protein
MPFDRFDFLAVTCAAAALVYLALAYEYLPRCRAVAGRSQSQPTGDYDVGATA